eukprot:jgi/Botrbrau1/8015/Bobra.384_2s0037.1
MVARHPRRHPSPYLGPSVTARHPIAHSITLTIPSSTCSPSPPPHTSPSPPPPTSPLPPPPSPLPPPPPTSPSPPPPTSPSPLHQFPLTTARSDPDASAPPPAGRYGVQAPPLFGGYGLEAYPPPFGWPPLPAEYPAGPSPAPGVPSAVKDAGAGASKTHCCVYALNMAYVANASAPRTAIAVTNLRSVPIAISCNGTSAPVLSKSDLAVRTPVNANGTIVGIMQLASQAAGTNPLYLATVEVAPDYMGDVGCRAGCADSSDKARNTR